MKHQLTRKDLADEQRRIDRMRREGRPEWFIKSWIRGWRKVAERRSY